MMDIAKAFDTVPHNRLRHKLQWCSVLSDCHQKVVIYNVSSDSVPVDCCLAT